MTAAAMLLICGLLSVTIAQQIDRPLLVADFVFCSGVFAIWLAALAIGFEVIR